jgi:hypothetical protein
MMDGPNWIYIEWAAYVVLAILALAMAVVVAGLALGGAFVFLKYFFGSLFGFGKIKSGPLGVVEKGKDDLTKDLIDCHRYIEHLDEMLRESEQQTREAQIEKTLDSWGMKIIIDDNLPPNIIEFHTSQFVMDRFDLQREKIVHTKKRGSNLTRVEGKDD